MTTLSDDIALSEEAAELVKMINEMARELMFCAYDHLPAGPKMKLSDLTRNTQRMLDESQAEIKAD